MKIPGQYFKNPLSLILATLVALALLGAWLYAKEAPGIDYYVAWVAADAVKNDTPLNIYEPSSRYKLAVQYRNKADELQNARHQKKLATHFKELTMTATPFLYWVTGLIATGDYEKDLTLWRLLSLVLITISILLLCRILGYSVAASLAILLPVVVWFTPFYSDLRVANVNSFQLGAISLLLWIQSWRADGRALFASGLISGLLVMFKPNLAPVALLLVGGWAVRRQYLQLGISLGGVVTGAVTAVLISSIWLGSATAWFDWLNYIRRFVDGGPGETDGNYSIITQVSSGISPVVQLGVAILLSMVCLAFFWWGRRRAGVPLADVAETNRELVENSCLVAMGCIVAMLASSLVWLHYYLLTMPMFIVAFRPWKQPGPMKIIPFLMLRVLPLVALVLLMDTPLREVIGYDGRDYWAAATMTSAVILFLVGLWQFGYGTRAQIDPQLYTDEARTLRQDRAS